MEFLEVYAEYGAIGILIALFVISYIKQNKRSDEQADALESLKIENRGQSETLENVESMVIKLVDRWNRSDEKGQKWHDDMVSEISDLSDVIMEVKGSVSRIDGRN